jgi:hypothetical protein
MFGTTEDAIWRTVEAAVKIIESEIKQQKRSDVILSERETNESRKIVQVLESLIVKIKELEH